MSEAEEERYHMQQNPKIAVINNLLTIGIKVVTIIGSIYVMKKQYEYIQNQLRRVVIEPSPNGRLIVSVYQMEALIEMRYATKEEVWDYSYKEMMNRLTEQGLL